METVVKLVKGQGGERGKRGKLKKKGEQVSLCKKSRTLSVCDFFFYFLHSQYDSTRYPPTHNMDLDKLDSYYLSRLARHYSAISPSVPAQIPSPPFPSPEHLSTAACQQWLVHHLLTPSSTPYRELAEEEGGASWRKSFWRRVLKAVEEGFALRESRGESIGDEVRSFLNQLTI